MQEALITHGKLGQNTNKEPQIYGTPKPPQQTTKARLPVLRPTYTNGA